MRYLTAVVVVLSLLSGWSCAQAPGDAQSFCTETLPSIGINILDYPPEVKPLMDSRHYQVLLPPNTGAVWQRVDNDTNNPSNLRTNWIQSSSSACRVVLNVCGFSAGTQDNWIITQHISRMVNGIALQQVTVQVDFVMNTCDVGSSNCRRSFAIHKYETSTINTTAARNLSNYERVGRIVPTDGSGNVRENGSVNINFATDSNATGFYLGIQDETSCILIYRLLVFYYVCPAETDNLITRPQTIAPIIGASQVVGECVENARPESGGGALFVCSQSGVWSSNIGTGCVCGSGFQSSSDGRSCVGCDPGMYLAVDDTCLPCPANSNSTQRGESVCPCFEGYYRATGEPPEMNCTQPPSAPLNLQVSNVTNTTVQLSWDPPVSNGGRDDLEYQLSYQIATSSESATRATRVNMTEGQITGLRPFTQYVVSVSSENGVSAQVTDTSGRTVNTSITTQEGVPSTIATDGVQVNNDIVTWQPPAEPNGIILHYNIRISQNGALVREVTRVTETRSNLSTLGLSAGTYMIQIQAVTSVGPGEYSQRTTIIISGQTTQGLPSFVIPTVVVLTVLILIITAGIIVCICLWYRHHHTGRKSFHHGENEAIALPTTRHRTYVDPTTYASANVAVHEYTREIPPKLLKLQEEIGAGEFGTVYKGTWKDGSKQTPIAVKTLRSGASTKMREDFLQEAAIMGQFTHANVVKLYGVVTAVEPYMIVMEFLENGSLYSYLRRNDDKLDTYRLVRMARGVAMGMDYLAIVGYVHRDLAARNVLVSQEEVCKVADFGLSRETVNDEYDVQKGGKIPVRWTAPEAISFRKFTTSSDVWSFGVLLWEVMSYAQHPYDEWDNQTVLDKLEAGYRLSKPKDCPDSVYNVMLDCWNHDHTRRPQFDQVERRLDILLESNINDGPKPKPRQKKTNSSNGMQATNPLHFQSVDEWLRAIKMDRYIPIFQRQGITDIGQCMQLTKIDLEEMGITLAGHLHKITQSVDYAHMELGRQPSVRI